MKSKLIRLAKTLSEFLAWQCRTMKDRWYSALITILMFIGMIICNHKHYWGIWFLFLTIYTLRNFESSKYWRDVNREMHHRLEREFERWRNNNR